MRNLGGEVKEIQEVAPVEYAGFWIRLGAYILDSVILYVIDLIVTWGAVYGNGSTTTTVLSIVLPMAYFVGFWTWRGQTPGKMVFKIKIIQTSGSPIGFGRSILRYIGYYVSAFILLIGFLWIAFDRRKQGIHDKIAETYVIRVP